MSGESRDRARWQSLVETGALVMIALGVAWSAVGGRRTVVPLPAIPQRSPSSPDAQLPAGPVSVGGAAILGQATAPETLIVYSDFQCPYCGTFERDTFPTIRTRYVASGRLRVAFREFPLSMHSFAQRAAEAAECAGRQGRFWEMHDQLFGHQAELDERSLGSYARSAGVEERQFQACMAADVATTVRVDIASGTALHVVGTPTFFLGKTQSDGSVLVTKRWSGAQSLQRVQGLLDVTVPVGNETSGRSASK
jgi:protein-disulfide isomerase